jgi:hypothetical protein
MKKFLLISTGLEPSAALSCYGPHYFLKTKALFQRSKTSLHMYIYAGTRLFYYFFISDIRLVKSHACHKLRAQTTSVLPYPLSIMVSCSTDGKLG